MADHQPAAAGEGETRTDHADVLPDSRWRELNDRWHSGANLTADEFATLLDLALEYHLNARRLLQERDAAEARAARLQEEREPVQAVAFVFLRGAEVLMERCPKKTRIHGGEWFVPGGRIEAGETAKQALCREVYEELGVSVHDYAALPLVDAQGWDRRGSFLMRPFTVTAWQGELPDHCLDHPDVALRWVPFGEALASPARAVRSILAQLPQTNRWMPTPTGATWNRVRELLLLLSRGERTVLTVEAKLCEILVSGAGAEVRDG